MYRPVPAQVDLPAMEREVLAFWHEHDIFARSLERTADGPRWVFYEGPPTANGMPGTHHVEARVFKDVFPRYRTMKGYHVPRKAGWDCHGLPVELAVEKELGFAGKQDIEAYGVAEFNARCRESVQRHVGEFERLTERMGYWVDMSDAYRTMDPAYIESVWWSLKVIFDRGLLTQDYRVAPYCPRCGTALSDHELAQGYETVVDPSVYVRFPVTGGPLAELGASLLVWTTTPWTLVSNTAVAAHPDVTYVAARTADGEVLVVAEPLLGVLGEGAEELARLTGRELERTPYQRPFELLDFPAGSPAHYVVLGEYVTTADGSGLVHQAPAFGEDDLRVCRGYGLPVLNPVREDGTFAPELDLVGGVFFKKADEPIVADLARRGLLFRHVEYEHTYPHCWRCHTPLLYYARPSWYIRTTAVKDELLRENERTNWHPASIKHGRYGDWLANNIDWALSRDRYWGTPLPIWRCEHGHLTCVGSLAELGELAGADHTELDPHRPFIDDVGFACPAKAADDGAPCGAAARRVPEVIDAWYDSGSMPFAQFGYPYRGTAEFEAAYPADYIAEAIDQTRGWFYSLMAVGTLVFDRSSYRDVVCLGHILAEDGRKMSKHLGNILEPIGLMDTHGADALRWFMAASGSPWAARRVGHATLSEIVRKTLLTYWNTVAFQALYARTAGWRPGPADPAPAERTLLDRWALSQVHQVAAECDAALADFDTQRAGRALASCVDELSNWYVRRSRRRFWNGDPAALATLHECLETLTRLLAPITPFIAERVWQDLIRPVTPDAPESVHLASWPEADPGLVEPKLSEQVALVRRLVELGRASRADSGVRTRHPLSRALVGASGWAALPAELRDQLAEELNVRAIAAMSGDGAGDGGESLLDYTAKANFRALGKRFGKQTPTVAAAIAAADAARLAAELRANGAATVALDSGPVTLGGDEIVISEKPRSGWAVASEGGESVALDLTLTEDLVLAGLAREAVRLVQEARKASGLDVADRIELWWAASDPNTAAALRAHTATIADEVLATSVVEADVAGAGQDRVEPPAEATRHTDAELGLSFALRRA